MPKLSNRRPVTVLSPVRLMFQKYNPNLIANMLVELGYVKKNISKHGANLVKRNLKNVLGTLPRHMLSNMAISLQMFERQFRAKMYESARKTSS